MISKIIEIYLQMILQKNNKFKVEIKKMLQIIQKYNSNNIHKKLTLNQLFNSIQIINLLAINHKKKLK